MKFPRTTLKRFHQSPWLFECEARIVNITGEWLELDTTIAFPEGGGQDADQGEIIAQDGTRVRFVDVRKLYGHPLRLPDFPEIQIDGIVQHRVDPRDQAALADLRPDATVRVRIDRLRRAQLALSHTASHLLYLGVGAVRPDALPRVIGCHIRTDGARFDFGVADRFTPDEVFEITLVANGYVERNSEVTVAAHPAHPDARFWRCETAMIPCGGTHLHRTGAIGPLRVKRKAMGRGKERLACTFPEAHLSLHEMFVDAQFISEAV